MKELILEHLRPIGEDAPARLRMEYRENENERGPHETVDFAFALDSKTRNQIRWYLEDYPLTPYGVFTSRAQGVRDQLGALGEDLFRAVFGTEWGRTCYASLRSDPANTRIRVIAASPEGLSLPWERMRDPARAPHGELVREVAAFVRDGSDGPPPRIPREPDAASSRLNILYVLSARPDRSDGDGGDGGDDTAAFQPLARPLIRAFRGRGDVHVEVLRPSTPAELADRLRARPGRFHVVHIDGDGDGDGSLDAFAGALAPGPDSAPLVLLHACRSASSSSATPPPPGTLLPLLAHRMAREAGPDGPCFVTIGYNVNPDTATRYAVDLYEQLARGESIHAANKRALLRLMETPTRATARGAAPIEDWATPLLFGAASVRLLARRVAPPSPGDAKPIPRIGMPEPPPWGSIGRDADLMRLENAFQQHNVVLLTGSAGTGKTEIAAEFARWQAESGALDDDDGSVFFFSFAHDTTLESILDTIGDVFKSQFPRTDGGRREQYLAVVDLLRRKPCLLIFDQFEAVAGFPDGTESSWTAQERHALATFLHALAQGGRSKALVTSRRAEPWLGIPGQPLALAGLPIADAERFAFAILQRAGMREEQIQALPKIAGLLRFLDGNPLALRLLLPELRLPGQEVRSLENQLRALGDRHDTHDRKDEDAGIGRALSVSLVYLLNWLDRHHPGLRTRLSVVGLFDGFVDADVLSYLGQPDDAPEILRGRTTEAWRADLDAAADAGLMQRIGVGCYVLEASLRWFFHGEFEREFGSRRAEFERLFAAIYPEYIEHLFAVSGQNPETGAALLRLEAGNLNTAYDFARRHGNQISAARTQRLRDRIYHAVDSSDAVETVPAVVPAAAAAAVAVAAAPETRLSPQQEKEGTGMNRRNPAVFGIVAGALVLLVVGWIAFANRGASWSPFGRDQVVRGGEKGPSPSSPRAVVVHVTSGDHIQVKMSDGKVHEVALWGTDAPELGGQAFAEESLRYLNNRLLGKTVTLQTMPGSDPKVLPAKVYLDGQMINDEMVATGLAWWASDWAPHSDILRQSQTIAIKTRRGLWAGANPTSPWVYRNQKSGKR